MIFEASVAVLFYVLGFDSVRIGGNRKTTDGPDIYAATPGGEYLVVECTSGGFNDEQLGKLLTRLKSARESLRDAPRGPASNQVTAVIVTPRTRDELGAQLRSAERQGVLILCGSDILNALELTQFTPNADDTLRLWRQRPLLHLLSHGLSAIHDTQ